MAYIMGHEMPHLCMGIVGYVPATSIFVLFMQIDLSSSNRICLSPQWYEFVSSGPCHVVLVAMGLSVDCGFTLTTRFTDNIYSLCSLKFL